MNIEATLQTKVKELESLRAKLQELDAQKQKCLELALETQGAVKQLVVLHNQAQEDLKKKAPPANGDGKKKKTAK